MPKVGMEPIRREALVLATIAEVGEAGSLDVTVSQIAKRAGMSSALAHHYFGGKDQIFLAAMRHILTGYGREVRAALAGKADHTARLEAIIRASFSDSQFGAEVISAWLNFYVKAQQSPDAARLLRLYHRRLHSNLLHDLRPLVGARADEVARSIAAMIDGVYIRQALSGAPVTPEAAAALVSGVLHMALAQDVRQ